MMDDKAKNTSTTSAPTESGVPPVQIGVAAILFFVICFVIYFIFKPVHGTKRRITKGKRRGKVRTTSKKYWRVVYTGPRGKADEVAASHRKRGQQTRVGHIGGQYVALVHR
jgi:hypothetical protein